MGADGRRLHLVAKTWQAHADEAAPRLCESCGAPADLTLIDGSSWCRACDRAASRRGF